MTQAQTGSNKPWMNKKPKITFCTQAKKLNIFLKVPTDDQALTKTCPQNLYKLKADSLVYPGQLTVSAMHARDLTENT